MKKAIEHNKRMFEQRIRMEDHALMHKCFDAWRATRYGSLAKQQILRRALMRMQRFCMARAFFAWKDKFNLVDKFHAMRRKVWRDRLGGGGAQEG